MSFPMACADIWIECESFSHRGGWVLDQQFMDEMGSPYLLAHGMGRPVADATATCQVPVAGDYQIWVRTKNWTGTWSDAEGPGRFQLGVNGTLLPTVLGSLGKGWGWQKAGHVNLPVGEVSLALHDLTGFDGRCDCICLTRSDEMPGQRPPAPALTDAGSFDVVVCGGGIAGISAAVAAARLGCRVALVNDRPLLGGNNSSEIRVHLGGRICLGPYPQLGSLQKEFGPLREGNAQPAENYEDGKKAAIVAGEPNISLFPKVRIQGVTLAGRRIVSVWGSHIESGKRLEFHGPVFVDCTGDGTVGALAGADFRMGREAQAEHQEPRAPEVADDLTMGASVQWYSRERETETSFPEFDYGMSFTDESCQRVTMGEWTWETGMNVNQVTDFERIRDYGLLVVYSNWSYLKNHLRDNEAYRKRELDWVAYVSGKRESRRLLGDYLLTENELLNYEVQPDGTAATTWTVDLHYPDPENSRHFPGREFKSIARHAAIYPYPVPYRCLYSRNTENLFMAGRNISVTHVALGTVRVMRTCGMLGEVVGMAADICRRHQVTPRGVYEKHWDELRKLMEAGVGKGSLPNNQHYNEGGTLKEPPAGKAGPDRGN